MQPLAAARAPPILFRYAHLCATSGGQGDYPHLVYGEEPIMYTKNFSDDSRYSYQGKDSSTGERMWVDHGPKSVQQKSEKIHSLTCNTS
jgi:hypothetical protein